MLKSGLLYEYEADTDWHYGAANSMSMDMIDAAIARDIVLDIVEILK